MFTLRLDKIFKGLRYARESAVCACQTRLKLSKDRIDIDCSD